MMDKSDEYGIVVEVNDSFQKTKYYNYTKFKEFMDYQKSKRNRGFTPIIVSKQETKIYYEYYVTGFNSLLEAKLYVSKKRVELVTESLNIIGRYNIDTTHQQNIINSLQGEIDKTTKWIQNKYQDYPEYLL